MATYKVCLEADVLTIGFADPGTNDIIVKDAKVALDAVNFLGGPLLKVTGPASLPVAMLICHYVVHKYGAIACFDPKLGKFVVCVTHNPAYALGDLI